MVAIKDMAIPSCCGECDFCTDDWCCKIQHKYINNFVPNHINRDPNCPLVEIGTCKDCKHWKDSDGVYRRGIGAESKCPINIKEVYEGNFYCKWFEERGDLDGGN